MHQTRKGKQWHFGMKLHIGADSRTGVTHSAVVTAANMHDKHALPELLHGDERRVYGDSACASQQELIAKAAPEAKDFTQKRLNKKGADGDEIKRGRNRNKSKTRALIALVLANIYLCRQQPTAQVSA